MTYDFSTLGALVGLALAIFLIVKKVQPVYSLILGALAGATIASQTFASTLLSAGIPALSAGAMIHAGSTVIDSLPHGSFFHATGNAANMGIKERLRLIPYEAIVGLTSTIMAVVIYLICG